MLLVRFLLNYLDGSEKHLCRFSFVFKVLRFVFDKDVIIGNDLGKASVGVRELR